MLMEPVRGLRGEDTSSDGGLIAACKATRPLQPSGLGSAFLNVNGTKSRSLISPPLSIIGARSLEGFGCSLTSAVVHVIWERFEVLAFAGIDCADDELVRVGMRVLTRNKELEHCIIGCYV